MVLPGWAVAWPDTGAVLQGWSCTQIFEGHSHYVMQVSLHRRTSLSRLQTAAGRR